MDNDFGKIRVHVEKESISINAYYDYTDEWNNMTFHLVDDIHVGNYADIVGHEYTHGVIQHSAELNYYGETGALNESFADIFGLMIKRYALMGGVGEPIWLLGDSETLTRSFENPNEEGNHSNLVGLDCISTVGQPDTYEGTFWQDIDDPCDNAGIHGNSGVQNHWFYILSHGSSGINDNDESYSVEGIGPDKAALITFWNLTNVLDSDAQYSDAREGAISSAQLLYGVCSNEHFQTINAWHAVGVGEISECMEVTSLESQIDLDEFFIYPNPTDNLFRIHCTQWNLFNVVIYNSEGKILISKKNVTKDTQFSLDGLAKGIYIIEVNNDAQTIRKRISKL
jgi:hypothetical protein